MLCVLFQATCKVVSRIPAFTNLRGELVGHRAGIHMGCTPKAWHPHIGSGQLGVTQGALLKQLQHDGLGPARHLYTAREAGERGVTRTSAGACSTPSANTYAWHSDVRLQYCAFQCKHRSVA